MREILFRGKRKDNGEWVYGDIAHIENRVLISYYHNCELKQFINDEVTINGTTLEGVFPFIEVVPETVGQATEYESYFVGDIIKSEQDGMIGVIRFGEYQTTNSGDDECHLGFYIEWYGKYSDIIRRDLGWWVKAANKDINIVGNIHDNPELLEVK